MSNKKYPNTKPFAHERNTNVNFNYVWDANNQEWLPMENESPEGSIAQILNNTKEHVHKFGSVEGVSGSVDQTDFVTIWDGATDVALNNAKYIFPPNSGETMSIASTSTDDTQTIVVVGLDQNFEEKSEEVVLTGTSPKALSGLWSRIFRAYNNGSSDLVGNVTISGTNTYAKIIAGNNQTLMSVYTIPANYTGYLLKYTITAQNTGSASAIGFTIDMKIREYGKVFRVLARTSAGTDYSIQEDFPFPLKLEPKSDIVFNIIGANGNNGSVNADFDIALV